MTEKFRNDICSIIQITMAEWNEVQQKSVILTNTIRYMIYRVKIVNINIYIYNKNSGIKEMSNDQKNSKYFGEIKQCWKLSTRILVC